MSALEKIRKKAAAQLQAQAEEAHAKNEKSKADKKAAQTAKLQESLRELLDVELPESEATYAENLDAAFAVVDGVTFYGPIPYLDQYHRGSILRVVAPCEGCGVLLYSHRLVSRDTTYYGVGRFLAECDLSKPSTWGRSSPGDNTSSHICERRKYVLVDQRSGALRVLAAKDGNEAMREALAVLGYTLDRRLVP